MKKLTVILASILGMFLFSAGSAYAFTVFLSGQVGASPVKNEVLLTDGTNSTWVATSTLGLGGSGGGTVLQVNSTYPILGGPITTTGTLSLAFGTTTANIWSQLQTFTAGISSAGITNSSLGAGTVNSTSGGVQYATATSTPTVTAPIAYSGVLGSFIGGVSGAFSCITATGSVAGCLSAADWTTFNNKQPAGNYITALTGDVTASGPGSAAATLATVNSNVGSFTSANITVNAKGLITAATNGSSGGTPGGLNTQLQYNNAGVFGGITGAVTDGTAVSLTNAHFLNPTINGTGTGLATLAYPNTSSSATITFPIVTGTLATLAGTEVLTNKDLTSGTNSFPTFNQNTTGSAATLTTSRTIGIATGDVTSAGSGFNGSANNTNAYTLATVNSNVGSFTNANVTVNAKGLITAASNGVAGGGVTGVTATYPILSSGGTAPVISTAFGTTTSNTFAGTQTFTNTPVLGTLTGFVKAASGVLSTSLINLASDVSGILPIANGGTGVNALSAGTVNSNGTTLYSTATSTVTTGTGLSYSGTMGSEIGGTSGTLTNTGVLSTIAGTGISVSGATGNVTIGNTGVTSIVAGTNITVSGSTGAVTINSTGGGSSFSYPFPSNATSTLLTLSGGETVGGTFTLSALTGTQCLQEISGAVSGTGSACSSGGGGTNFFTSNGAGTTYLNNNPILAAPSFNATSTTATSTFAGDVSIGSTGLPNPYLFIGTSTSHLPIYGRIAGDLIDSELDWNGVSSINVANANKGSCAASTYFADGNNPTLGGYFGTFSFLNDGWTNGGGAGCFIGTSNTDKPEAVAIASPTGEMDFDIASTSQNGSADFNWNVNNATLMKLTNAGNLGIGSTTPSAPLTIATQSFTSGYMAEFDSGPFVTPSIEFSQAGTEYQTLKISNGGWVFYSATSTQHSVANAVQELNLSATSALFQTTGTNALFVGPNNSNPALTVNDNVANSATGLSITTAATGGTTAIATTDSGAASSLTINAKGTGTTGIDSVSTGAINIGNSSAGTITTNTGAANFFIFNFGGVSKANISATADSFSPASRTLTGPFFQINSGIGTGLTASTESTQFLLNSSGIQTHANGAIATMREVRIQSATDTFTAGGSIAATTIASTSQFSIDGPPIQGAIANYTNTMAEFIGQGTPYTSASTTNAYGLVIQSPVGAANNYAASTTGRIVLGGLATISSGDTLCRNTAGEIGDAGSATCSISTLLAKHNIVSLTQGALDNFSKLRAVHYDLNGSNLPQYGFIAEEVAKLYPDAVIYAKTDVQVPAEKGGFNTVKAGQPLTVDYEHMVPILWYQVQQLQLGAMKPVRSVEENWQDFLIGLLILGFIFQQLQINRLKK